MAHPRRFRFGIQLSQPLDGMTWAETAQHVESLGYSSLQMPDHFGDQLAPLTALAVAAGATSTLKVGALVFGNDYRHPVTLATEMATLDVLSSGRVEVGLGAGWMTTDYEQSGIPLDPPGVRVDRLEESLQVVQGLFGGNEFSFAGEHYQLSGMTLRPHPYTDGGPPLVVGGGGRRVLSIAARYADIVGINSNMRAGVIGVDAAVDALPDATDRKVDWVREAAGDRFDDIELNALAFLAAVCDDAGDRARSLAEIFGTDATELLDSPVVLLGTLDEIEERLLARRERWGFSYYVFSGPVADEMAPVVARLTGR
jgi:probable F420-dependent oxidoreductase